VHEVHDIYVTNTSYTDFNINKLSNVLSLEAISSGLLISNISKEFSKIDINNSLGNINLYMETDAHYLLSLAPDNYIEGLSGLSNLKREENGREIYQVGAQGKGGTILLNCDRCKFDIQ